MSGDEFARIEAIAARLGAPSSRVRLGIGDDTAVLTPPSEQMLFCSDAMVEGIHFDLRYVGARDLGHKALASCLSDIAAMNGRPLYAVISLGLPARAPESFVDDLYLGIGNLARSLAVDIVGGDLSSSKGGIFIDVAAVGESTRPLTRTGARVGDVLAVSGALGSSAAGLHLLQSGNSAADFTELANAHLRPTPRFDLLPGLVGPPPLGTALIDISDGLSSEAHHLARRSGVGFEIMLADIPLSDSTKVYAESEGLDPLEWVLHGGEDYQLLATFSPDLPLPAGWIAIGRAVSADHGVKLKLPGGQTRELAAQGYRHFASS